jgi:RNA polymerase sigma factor (sigma-70 family)
MSHFGVERGYHGRKKYQPMQNAHQPESVFLPMKPNRTGPARPEKEDAGLLPNAFDALFAEHWPHVYRVLLRLVGDPAEAEDLALESFFRLYQQNPTARGDFNPGGWLHRVAINLGLHSIRSFKRREHYEISAGKNALEETSENRPAEIMVNEEDQRTVRIILTGMPARQAELLILRYSGATYKEIAATQGLSPTSIGPSLLRAEREFEKRYRALVREEV